MKKFVITLVGKSEEYDHILVGTKMLELVEKRPNIFPLKIYRVDVQEVGEDGDSLNSVHSSVC